MPPHTTKRKTTTNLKNKNNQNCQKIELYGGPTTKELKKKHSTRSVGRAEWGSWVERTCGKAGVRGPGWARWQLAASGSGVAVACRLGSPTFACR